MMNKFKTGQQTVNNKQRELGPTKKRKNTYVVNMDVMANFSMFEMCLATPMAVVEINGVVQQKNDGWMKTTSFPNPGASEMALSYHELAPFMGKKLAGTIVEYLDRETGEPIAMLFPTNRIMVRGSDEDFEKRLNHATRRDLKRQCEIRNAFIEKYLAQKQK